MSELGECRYYVYCAFSELNDEYGLKKLGLTIHPVHRLRQYATSVPPSRANQYLKYNGLWQIDVDSRSKLREMEHILHTHFTTQRDGTSEWFNVTFDQVADFMASPQKFKIQQVSFDEIKMINTKFREPITASETRDYEEEDILQKEKASIPVIESDHLYEKFIRTFLPGKVPRRVQIELWNLFKTICETPDKLLYRGIIQWPTGVGKTIATLMLIVIAADRSKTRGEFYRGLFVSPKNDILDTISKDFNRLSEFGITVYDGSHGKLSSLVIPTNSHILISACQASLIDDEKGMRRLPHMTHVHYDEVHRITGELYFQLLKEMLATWETEILTGTSATPKTSSNSQHEKLAELFGDPYTLLHKCDVDEAVKEGWIAKPKYMVSIVPKNEDRAVELDAYMTSIKTAIEKRKAQGLWSGGKIISFTPDSVSDVEYCSRYASTFIPEAKIYVANGDRTDDAFVNAPADGTLRILFACQRFREGSDVKGLEMVSALVGNTTAVYILLQMCGRALRLDYEGKEGWCLIVRPSESGTTEEDVLDSIILDIIEYVSKSDKKYEPKELEPLIRMYLGDITMSGSDLTIDDTIERVQAAYVRRLYRKQKEVSATITYSELRTKVVSVNILTRQEYSEKALINQLPEDPSDVRGFKTWYDLLKPSDEKRMTLYELQRLCKEHNIVSKAMYELRSDLPSWNDLIDGYLSDLPGPLPSHLESELFQTGRGRR